MKQYTFYDDRSYVPTRRTRQQLDKGCFRMIPDTYYDQPENWRERMYDDRRPVKARKARQKRQ